MTVVVSGDNWSYKTCKWVIDKGRLQSYSKNRPCSPRPLLSALGEHPLWMTQSSSQIITNTQRFTGQMPFLSPNLQCQSTDGKINFH